MAKRKNRKQGVSINSIPSSWFLIGGVVLLALAALGVWALSSSNSSPSGGKLGPRLAVNQERIDLGKQPFDKMVRAEFQIQNDGDQVLVLDASAPIRVLEGC